MKVAVKLFVCHWALRVCADQKSVYFRLESYPYLAEWNQLFLISRPRKPHITHRLDVQLKRLLSCRARGSLLDPFGKSKSYLTRPPSLATWISMLTRNLLVQAIVQGLFPHSKYLPRLIDALFYVSPHILHAREQPGFTPFASVSTGCHTNPGVSVGVQVDWEVDSKRQFSAFNYSRLFCPPEINYII